MKWRGRRGSRNIEDRRGARMSTGAKGAGGAGLLIVVVVAYFLGVDVTPFLNGGTLQETTPAQEDAAQDQAAQFVSVVLADTEEVWADLFPKELGKEYDPPVLVLFRDQTQSPCGGANGATGPFYCPADRKAYLDTSFFVTLERRLGAGGDFAAAYVVAHEVAHHVQNEMGVLGEANRVRARVSEAQANGISVRIELQADCLSGVWARHAQQRIGALEPGDIEEAMNAARQIGDDTLQRNAGRRPMPHTFTHGTSEQRQTWFLRGYQSASMRMCDTFAEDAL
ncbi:KPN_02809 family neutral zinc metallopeptidase [Algicella marina]|uniref:Metalloprotease n=1 Tax=Algicella marina TaxID=2683284 RepID=A0A6P1T0W6_9RHOB|nr:neutral zinc metallopeptidase [Algicella marina]QHQ35086.1 hypothetical protein GO499_07695 [Algicella marina]